MSKTGKFELNENQVSALMKIDIFLNSESQKIFSFVGVAGSGKSTIMKFVQNKYDRKFTLNFIAPTHKAKNILSKNDLWPVSTCDSFLNYKLTHDMAGNSVFECCKTQWHSTYKHLGIDKPVLLIVDECSMLSDDKILNFIEFLKFLQNKSDVIGQKYIHKIIYVGDSSQLPAVETEEETGEALDRLSLSFYKFDSNAILTKVMRTNVPEIQKLCNIIRDYTLTHDRMCFKNQLILFENENKSPNIRFKHNEKLFINNFIRKYKENHDTYILVYDNANKNKYNKIIKDKLFSKSDEISEFKTNQIIMFDDYYNTGWESENKGTSFYCQDKARITNIEYEKYFKIPTFENVIGMYIYTIETIDNDGPPQKFKIYKYDKQYKKVFDNELKKKKQDIEQFIEYKKTQEKNKTLESLLNNLWSKSIINDLWTKYNRMKKIYNIPISDCYALTIHKSQGSTMDNVLIHLSSILRCANKNDFKLSRTLYTSVSRAKKYVSILYEYNNVENLNKINVMICGRCRCYKNISLFYNEKKILLTICQNCSNKDKTKRKLLKEQVNKFCHNSDLETLPNNIQQLIYNYYLD